ncbi:MAG: metallophosphoesterase, partial [Candidatus Aminicenantes bacterium]
LFFSLASCRNSGTTVIKPFCGFEALDPNNNRVIFIGDTQGTSLLEFWREDNKEKTPLLIREIAHRNPACVINLGDLVFCGTSQKQWKLFDEAHKPILKNKIPYFPLPGNHEYWCSPKKTFENYFARFPHLDKRKWYSFRFQNIGFLMLDSNFSKLTPGEKRCQVDWYDDELFRLNDDPEINYIIVCCHHPPFTNSKVVKPSEKALCCFLEPFLRLKKIAAFFSGHCHSYEKFKKRGKYFIVSGGGGGPRQKLETNKKKRQYDDLFAGPSLRFLNFCQMTIEPDRLYIRVIKLTDDGKFEPVDEITIHKP